MKAVILAAGYATRLYPLTENYPKPLLPVGGKPILDWLIEDLVSAVDEFVVVTNHRFADTFHDWAQKRKVCIRICDDGTTTNDGRLGAVRDLELASQDIRDDVFVMAGDNVLDFSLLPFLDFTREKDTSCVMCHEELRLEALQKTAVITTDDHDRITSYEEKPKNPKGHFAVPPFYFYREQDIAKVSEALKAGCAFDAPGSFAAWLSARTPMHAWKMLGHRYDIGDLSSYEAMRESYCGLSNDLYR